MVGGLAATQPPSPESAAALEAICRAYWYPLYAYVRRCGQSPHDAQDLTQEFFCRLLEKRWLESADREKGKLRTFLMVALKTFMSKEWRRASAQRRGGGQRQRAAGHRLRRKPLCRRQPFARRRTKPSTSNGRLTLLDLTVNRLRDEFAAAGKPGDFDILKGCLMAERGAIDYAAVASRLGVNEGAARVAVHRLRKRFREIYREEISQTLAEARTWRREMRHLAAALARRK